jgi:hypothetical protein
MQRRIQEERMRNTTAAERAQAWVVDYSAARMRAIRWLGDRYLLARPINAGENARGNTAAADLGRASSALGPAAAQPWNPT